MVYFKRLSTPVESIKGMDMTVDIDMGDQRAELMISIGGKGDTSISTLSLASIGGKGATSIFVSSLAFTFKVNEGIYLPHYFAVTGLIYVPHDFL